MDNTNAAAIDKEGDALKKSAATAFELIMALRRALDNSPQAAHPLFVSAGENHENLPEHIHHMILIDAISRVSDNFAVSFEIKHNAAPKLSRIENNADYLSVAKSVWNLNYAINELETPYCNYTNRLLLRQCKKGLEQGRLSCVFSDVSSKNTNYMRVVDINDPSTQASFIATQAPDGKFSTTSPIGTMIRDHHMFTKMKEHAEATGARIVYHCTGADHLDGLSRHFSDAGLPYLNLISEQCLTYAPTKEMQASMHTLKGLPDVSAHYIPSIPKNPPDMLADIVTQEEEQHYVHAKLDYLGLSHLK
tara:strand:- start:432321 stop:433238 length:918 start_codon:yes stop_codon:yes gene_type:complete